jgi:hypothetical protein
VSDTERIERIRKDPDEALNYIRDLTKERDEYKAEVERLLKKCEVYDDQLKEQTQRTLDMEAEVERQAKIHEGDMKIVDHWKAEVERLKAGSELVRLDHMLSAMTTDRDTAVRLLRELVNGVRGDTWVYKTDDPIAHALAAAEKYLEEIGGETCPKCDTRKP